MTTIRPGTAPVLSVDRLNVTADGRPLLKDVSFELAAGDRVGLIGESGSGKSLTSLSVIGLLPDGLRATGSIRMTGVDHEIVGATDRQMATLRGNRIGMVFQEPMTALNPTMRIGAQVAEVLLVHRVVTRTSEALARARELLAQVRLPDPDRVLRSYPHQLSGGQRQRVVLAIAMANRPSVLLCDEPTTALDVTVQAQMLDLISTALDETDAALLFVTHDLAVVATICERVVVMFAGEVLEAGRLADVFREPRHPYTRGLLAASDLESLDEDGRLRTIPADLFSYRDRLDACAYCTAPDRPADEDRALSRWVPTPTGGFACWHSDEIAAVSTVERAA
jgi:ABC-type dipeptide/oligopeptide/nickel transport system ATPase component